MRSSANQVRLLYFLVFCCTASWLPVFADFLKNKGLSGVQIGVALGVTPLMMLFVQPFYGLFIDQWGYRRSLLGSSLFAAVCYFLFLVNSSYVYVLIITVGMSVFYNAIQPILDSLSLRLVQQDPSFSYGSLRIAGAAGWASTGIVIGYLIDNLGVDSIFYVSGGSMLLLFLVALALPRDLTQNLRVANVSLRAAAQVFGNVRLLGFLMLVFLVSAGSTCIYYFYSIYMKQNGASATLVGYALSFQGLCELPFFYWSEAIIRRLGLPRTFLLTVGATVVRMLLYAYVTNPYWAVGIELLQGVSWSLFWVVCVAYVGKLVHNEWLATGQSLLYAAFYGIGAIVGNLWTGYLYDAQWSLPSVFLLNALLVAAVGGVYFLLNFKKAF
jgi:MFS transporter, PPP family, 3-phenylpropionic acid transporter